LLAKRSSPRRSARPTGRADHRRTGNVVAGADVGHLDEAHNSSVPSRPAPRGHWPTARRAASRGVETYVLIANTSSLAGGAGDALLRGRIGVGRRVGRSATAQPDQRVSTADLPGDIRRESKPAVRLHRRESRSATCAIVVERRVLECRWNQWAARHQCAWRRGCGRPESAPSSRRRASRGR